MRRGSRDLWIEIVSLALVLCAIFGSTLLLLAAGQFLGITRLGDPLPPGTADWRIAILIGFIPYVALFFIGWSLRLLLRDDD